MSHQLILNCKGGRTNKYSVAREISQGKAISGSFHVLNENKMKIFFFLEDKIASTYGLGSIQIDADPNRCRI